MGGDDAMTQAELYLILKSLEINVRNADTTEAAAKILADMAESVKPKS